MAQNGGFAGRNLLDEKLATADDFKQARTVFKATGAVCGPGIGFRTHRWRWQEGL